MRWFKVIYRDGRTKRVFAVKFVPEGTAYVFYNESGYGFETIPMYLVADIEEAE